MRIPLASGAYKEVAPGSPARVCRNLYLEKADTDPKRSMKLVRTPGSLELPDWAANARGYAQADGFASGVILVVVGTALKTYDPATGTVGTIAGTVAGTDRVQFAFTALECAILANGVLHFSDGATVATAADVDFPAAITSVAAIEQRFVFSYGTEGRWGYTEVGDGDNTTVISYYTAEYSPDGLVALFVLGARLFLFGSQTLEEWYPTGDSDNPFRRASGRVVETGCLCRDSIRKLDNTVYWIDRECSVRRIGSAETPEIVSTPAISRAIRATDSDDIICMAYEVDGHAFYIVRLPDEGCFALDPNTGGEWHERQTNLTDTWRYGYIVSAAGQHFVGDFAGVGFAILSRAYQSEHMADADTMGTEIVCVGSGFGSISEGFEPVNSLRIEGSRGQGLSSGQGSAPTISVRVWKGDDWSAWMERPTGAQGNYRARTIFRRLGVHRAPGFEFQFRVSDPVVTVIDGAAINED
jgi:hypothetical protein